MFLAFQVCFTPLSARELDVATVSKFADAAAMLRGFFWSPVFQSSVPVFANSSPQPSL
jgi:hypothetical protein